MAENAPNQSHSPSVRQRNISAPSPSFNNPLNIQNNEQISPRLISKANYTLKDAGWYWGSISPGYAVKIIENKPEGAFLVRDSSSDYFIFSITLKLNGQTHHSRIEHNKGYYTFNRSPKFKCRSIVEFIEAAIEYSQNEGLSFFLHRDPSEEGPVRLRLTPVSRLKAGSLKHMCRFAILPYVKRDKISELCLPSNLTEYLSEPFS